MSVGTDVVVYVPVPPDQLRRESPVVERSGGALVLLLLVEALRKRGVSADAVSAFDGRAAERYGEGLQRGDLLAVYPECITDNPLKARAVVRWVLYHPDRVALRRWRVEGDIVAFYWPKFDPDGVGTPALRLADAGLTLFQDHGSPRTGICWRIGKGRDYQPDLSAHDPAVVRAAISRMPRTDALEHLLGRLGAQSPVLLPDGLTRREMADTFNRFALFLSYDVDSAVSGIAALCGCVSVVVPFPANAPPGLLPCYRHGVAWGLDDIPRALRTVPTLRDDLATLEAQGGPMVDDLLALTRSRWGLPRTREAHTHR